MADNLPTVWPADRHTLAKHSILKAYLDAWMPILSRQSAHFEAKHGRSTWKDVLFVDAFAGPGEYEGGEPGSPIIALRAAANHLVRFPIPVRLVFNELDKNRYQHLTDVVAREQTALQSRNNVVMDPVQNLTGEDLVSQLLSQSQRDGSEFGPALVFLDQFGFAAVSMETIARVMENRSSEVFLLLDFRGMNRWISDKSKAVSFNRAFGGAEWQPAQSMNSQDQESYLLDQYVVALRSRGNADYVTSFSMFDDSDRLLYRLIFCTNNLRGLEKMKESMWKVDKTGECKFSDRDCPGQLRLLSAAFDQSWLAEDLLRAFAAKTVSVHEVREYVLVHTPCYLFKNALKRLEMDSGSGVSCISAPAQRKAGTYSDNLHKIILRFSARPLF
jgi:three-Cys-motif partner protein